MNHNEENKKELQMSVDTSILEESALAMAQAVIQSAIDKSGLSRIQIADKLGNVPYSYISTILCGSHDYLSIKEMARILAVCGYEIRFNIEPIRTEE